MPIEIIHPQDDSKVMMQERKTENFKVSNNRDVEKNYNEKLTEGFGRLEVISELRAVQGTRWGWGRISED